MGERTLGTAGAGSRGQGAGARRPWPRSALATIAALALALPLSALTSQRADAAPDSVNCTPFDRSDARVGTGSTSSSTRESVARSAAARWFPASQVGMATAIAGAESSWNPTAVNKAAGGNYGLWQINTVHADLLRGRNWRTPETNAWMAYQVWDAADGQPGDRQGSWTPWSVYNSGSYRSFLRSADVAPQPVACVSTGGPEVRVGTWNVLRTNSDANIEAGTRDLMDAVDVFGLQELGSPTKRAAAARGAVGFTMSTDRTAVPIFYRTAQYTLIDQGRELAFDAGQRVERYGADDRTVTARKWVTWVHLMDNITYQDFYVLNTHLLVGAQSSARTSRANERRMALYDRQLATLTRLADGFRASGSAVYATCDCNVNFSAEAAPVLTMRDHGLTPSWQTLEGAPTHGKRYIDYVWSNATPFSQVTGSRHGSDHASLVVTFLPSTVNAITGSTKQAVAGTRTVTDPQSGQTFTVPVPTGRAGTVVGFALDQLGDRWSFGSRGPDSWDCSGLTARAYRAAGVSITPQSNAQERSERQVPLAQAQPGDIVWRKGYVAIYLGTVDGEPVVVGSLRAKGAVVIHTMKQAEIKAVLRPTA